MLNVLDSRITLFLGAPHDQDRCECNSKSQARTHAPMQASTAPVNLKCCISNSRLTSLWNGSSKLSLQRLSTLLLDPNNSASVASTSCTTLPLHCLVVYHLQVCLSPPGGTKSSTRRFGRPLTPARFSRSHLRCRGRARLAFSACAEMRPRSHTPARTAQGNAARIPRKFVLR